jgi:DNA processing protein
MDPNLIYQVALTQVPNIGAVQARTLLQHLEVGQIFSTKKHILEKIEGIGSFRANAICRFKDFSAAEKEVAFIEKNRIRPLLYGAEDYPRRLMHCYDPPTLLYLKGEAVLNAEKVLGVIGTRNLSDYGRQATEKLIKELAGSGAVIVSGLAYGIDATAHKAALKHKLPTVAVLAHGLNQVYPGEHIPLAKEMVQEGGGLLTEFNTFSKPDRHNFPIRNRIVAGLCDAVVVMETGMKGGSMITADLANGYNRDVFAFPGRTTDLKSEGCNFLIRKNKAGLVNNASELVEALGWDNEKNKKKPPRQRELFIELNPEEKRIVDLLRPGEPVHIDELQFQTGLTPGQIASTLLNLEFRGVIASSPGKSYRLHS